jgi:hypothetical protein
MSEDSLNRNDWLDESSQKHPDLSSIGGLPARKVASLWVSAHLFHASLYAIEICIQPIPPIGLLNIEIRNRVSKSFGISRCMGNLMHDTLMVFTGVASA